MHGAKGEEGGPSSRIGFASAGSAGGGSGRPIELFRPLGYGCRGGLGGEGFGFFEGKENGVGKVGWKKRGECAKVTESGSCG